MFLLFGRKQEKKETSQNIGEKQVLEAMDMLGITSRLTDREKKLFLALAVRNQLDPLKREIHAMERKQNVTDENGNDKWIKVMVPVTGYEVFIDRAEATGRLAWWDCETVPEGEDLKCTVRIQRKDWPKPFVWTCWLSEVKGNGPVWLKEKDQMLRKVTISRGFRLCFRQILRDMPYSAEEQTTIVDEDRPALVEPQEVKLVEASKELDKELEQKTQEQQTADRDKAEKEAQVKAQITAARSELSAIYKKMATMKKKVRNERTGSFEEVGMWSAEEVSKMEANAQAAKDDLEKLRNLAAEWLNDLLDREEAAKQEAGK